MSSIRQSRFIFILISDILDFIPDSIGAPWAFGVQNRFDQSTGDITTFPPISHLDYDERRNAIASLIPPFDVVGDYSLRAVAVN